MVFIQKRYSDNWVTASTKDYGRMTEKELVGIIINNENMAMQNQRVQANYMYMYI